MSKTFELSALVKRTVYDTVLLKVEADNINDAYGKAEAVLEIFPDPHDEQGINYCYIEKREQQDRATVLDMSEGFGGHVVA